MSGVGFGPDNLYRIGEDSLTGKLLENMDSINPLDILFEGDDDEEVEEVEVPKNMYGRQSNFGAEKFANINDFESRFDFEERKKSGLTSEGDVDKERLKIEISNLISDIGRQDGQRGFRQEAEEGEGENNNFGSRKDRRARKRNDYESSSSNNVNGESRGFSVGANGEDEYTQAVSNMMREINKNDNEIRNNNYLNTNSYKNVNTYENKNENSNENENQKLAEESYSSSGFKNNESGGGIEEFQMYDVEEEIPMDNEEDLVFENKDIVEEDSDAEEYSLIGDD